MKEKTNIKSLKDLREHKLNVEKQLIDCESNIYEKYNRLTNPVKIPLALLSGKNSRNETSILSVKNVAKSFLTINNLITFANIGIAVYKRVKHRRASKYHPQ